jgi:hypothetical protein
MPVIIGDLTAKCNFVKELFLTHLGFPDLLGGCGAPLRNESSSA